MNNAIASASAAGQLPAGDHIHSSDILEAVTLSLQGKDFPAVFQDFPNPFVTRQVTRQAEITAEYPNMTPKSHSKTLQAVYSSPVGWLISEAHRVEVDHLGPLDATFTFVPGGYQLLTNEQYETEFNSARDYLLNLNILDKWKADLTVKLSTYQKNLQSYASSISASHASAIHKVTLQGAGNFNGRTMYHGWIDVTEVSAPPLILNPPTALRSGLKQWVDSAVKMITAVRRTALKCFSGQYVCAEGGGGGTLVADRNAVGAWETLDLLDLDNGNVAIRSANGNFVSAVNGGGAGVTVDRTAIGSWETFALVMQGSKSASFKTANGDFLCAEGGGGQQIVANRVKAGPWETFEMM